MVYFCIFRSFCMSLIEMVFCWYYLFSLYVVEKFIFLYMEFCDKNLVFYNKLFYLSVIFLDMIIYIWVRFWDSYLLEICL